VGHLFMVFLLSWWCRARHPREFPKSKTTLWR